MAPQTPNVEVAEVRFTESGALESPFDKRKLSGCRDIFLLCHGWLNDPQSARQELYEPLAAAIANVKNCLFQKKNVWQNRVSFCLLALQGVPLRRGADKNPPQLPPDIGREKNASCGPTRRPSRFGSTKHP